MNSKGFRIVLTDEAIRFLQSLSQSAADKIYYNLHRVSAGEVNVELFKKLENSDIWEFRTLYNKTAYRLFAFWDTQEETLVIATHGIIKKTQKTPSKEITKAEQIRAEYFKRKKEH
jgi:phage-related protein